LLKKSPDNLWLLAFHFFPGDGLAEAAVSLSTARLSEVAAAVLEAPQLKPIILEEHPELLGPRLRTLQIGENGPEAGPGFLFLTHGAALVV
jgi:hypothetical protein